MASAFSGSTGRKTGIWTAQMANQQLGDLRDIYGQGYQTSQMDLGNAYNYAMPELARTYGVARGAIGSGINAANRTIVQGRDVARKELMGQYGQAIDAANMYYGQGVAPLQQAAAGYDPFIQRGNTAGTMYANSLGLNGAQGTTAAQGAFQAGPGYQWNVDQATEAAARQANLRGMTYSGNTIDATARLAENLANQEYGNWQTRLQGSEALGETATQGKATSLGQLSQLYQGQGNQNANLHAQLGTSLANATTGASTQVASNYAGQGAALAGLATQYGTDTSSLAMSQGTNLANLAQTYTGQNADATNNYYNTVIEAGQKALQAGQQAAQNRTGAIMGGLQLGGQLLGGAFGGAGGAAASGGSGGWAGGFLNILKGLFK